MKSLISKVLVVLIAITLLVSVGCQKDNKTTQNEETKAITEVKEEKNDKDEEKAEENQTEKIAKNL